jgi:fatty acid CoA ligase FadD9
VLNHWDDGVSLDVIVQWVIRCGVGITRINDYDDWLDRFETALRNLPGPQRERSVLPLLEAYRAPALPLDGG